MTSITDLILNYEAKRRTIAVLISAQSHGQLDDSGLEALRLIQNDFAELDREIRDTPKGNKANA